MISAKIDKCEVSGKDLAAVEIKIEGSHTEVMVEFMDIIIALRDSGCPLEEIIAGVIGGNEAWKKKKKSGEMPDVGTIRKILDATRSGLAKWCQEEMEKRDREKGVKRTDADGERYS